MAVIIALQKMDTPPVSSIMLADSKCSISAVQPTKPLLPYYQNRVAEIRDNMDQVRKLCPMEEIHYVESTLNPSDMSTHVTTKMSELGPNSIHQLGPKWFSLPRSEWPVSQDNWPAELPTEEIRIRDRVVFAATLRAKFCNADTVVHDENSWTVIEGLLRYSDNINKIIRIIARYLIGLEREFRKSNVIVLRMLLHTTS